MERPTVLRTARLVLRPPEPADAGWIATGISHPDVQRMLTSPPHPYRLADAEAWLAENAGEGGQFVIVAGEPCGVITLRLDEPDGELGYWLGISAWGQGFMTEAARAVLAWHFARSDDPVPSGYITDNPASRNVLGKLGFRETRMDRRHCNFRGEEVDIQRMIQTRDVWAAGDVH